MVDDGKFGEDVIDAYVTEILSAEPLESARRRIMMCLYGDGRLTPRAQATIAQRVLGGGRRTPEESLASIDRWFTDRIKARSESLSPLV